MGWASHPGGGRAAFALCECDAPCTARHAVSGCVRVDRERNQPKCRTEDEEQCKKGRNGGRDGREEKEGKYTGRMGGIVRCAAAALEFAYVREKGKRRGTEAEAAAGAQQRLLREAQHHDRLSRAERARHASLVPLSPSPPGSRRPAVPPPPHLKRTDRAPSPRASSVYD